MEVTPVARLKRFFTQLISETNGLSLEDTLTLAQQSPELDDQHELAGIIRDFHERLGRFRLGTSPIEDLLSHPASDALASLFCSFPIPFREEHIHLTGSLSADFIYPRLAPLLDGPDGDIYASKIAAVYGPQSLPIRSVADVD